MTPLPLYAMALFVASGLSIWAAVIARSRRLVPGSVAFSWMMLAAAHWGLMDALHALVPNSEARVLVIAVKYLPCSATSLLWLFFTADYARISWPSIPAVRVLLSIVPVLTVAAALSNPSHGLLWADVAVRPDTWGPITIYTPGPWFWIHIVHSYVLVAIGSWMLAVGMRSHPPPYTPQRVVVWLGVLLTMSTNFYFVTHLAEGARDITPVAFGISGSAFSWALFRHRLFGLVPTAHDMVVESMEDGVAILDADRRIIEMNRAAERLTGCTPASVGQEIGTVVPWWSAGKAEERRSPEMPAVVRVEPGPRFLEVRVSPVRNREQPFSGWLVLLRDVTTRRRAEAERYALERRVQEQQKNESLTVFAAGIAHDFNNILTGILGNADLLALQAPAGSSERHTADQIILGAQRAADLVSKMLAYAGEGLVVSERVDIGALVGEMVQVLGASAADHCTVIYRAPEQLPPVDVDPTQIRQVLLNLILNAIEAVDQGGVVTVETGQESLDRDALSRMTYGSDVEPGRYVFVDVVDNGHGMCEQTRERMFDPFFSTKEAGRGLGLATVRGIVRSHQAALRVTSAPGQGTRMRVWLSQMPGRQVRAS